MNKSCLVSIEGGLGKNVMFTSILKLLHTNYETIYTVSPYYDVFKCCKEVEDSFPMGNPSLYQLVMDNDVDVLWKEPYSNRRFIKKECHLFDAWCEELGIEQIPNKLDINAYLSGNKPANLVPDIDVGKEYPELVKGAKELSDKLGKFILVQFCGGQSPLQLNDKYDWKQEVIKRNYFKAQELINALHAKYPDCKIVHFSLKTEPSFDNAEKIEAPYLMYHELAKYAYKVVCTDSSLQHLVTGVCHDVTVIWGETRPEHFGYACNKNICAQNVINSQPYFRPLGVSPAIVKMPSVEDVMDAVACDTTEWRNK